MNTGYSICDSNYDSHIHTNMLLNKFNALNGLFSFYRFI